ncbi:MULTISPECIES: ABC transporter substrate-binding protein [unclassified Pseudoclavibacter]|uniref:ABC transporter substrate-binding protein n=1 Tax=unclassified Pseudoclavibacter TaxID=2615177 RepID=UPI001300E85B|nr:MULTISPECIES: ABC transporter substrate-binding protein [unclassified Pseudoclavibacter]KAB1657451.1 ABC transporter substrate-binding protein [Pseudoclavibacter sp. CFCC 11306]KAB1660673.1 ABC transporter substrate-binding protein [Pseudoclavibacter sp. CFCC 13796]
MKPSIPASFASRQVSRRSVLAAGLLGAAGLGLAACSGPSVGAAGTTQADTTDWSKVTPADKITWWSNHPGKSQDIENQLIAKFNEKHPEIQVELVTAGKDYDEVAAKFQAASSGDNIPDLVIASDVWWFRYFINGQLLPLDGVLSQVGTELDDYNATLLGDYKYQDQLWALPYARSTPLFYYNKSAWEQAGLPDRGPATWDEFEEWAPKLNAVSKSGQALALGKGTSWAAWWFCNMMWGQGGRYSDDWDLKLTSAETEAAGEYLRKLIHEQKFAAIATEQDTDFGAGAFPCTLSSTGSLGGILKSANFEVGTAFLPDGPQGGGCPTGGTGIGIPAKSTPERQLAAATFLSFITEPDNTALFSAGTGYIPVRTSAIQSDSVQQLLSTKPQFKTAIDQLAQKSRSQDWARVFVPGGDKILTDGIEQIMVNNTAAAEAFGAITPQLQQAYDENVKPYLKN